MHKENVREMAKTEATVRDEDLVVTCPNNGRRKKCKARNFCIRHKHKRRCEAVVTPAVQHNAKIVKELYRED